MDGDLRRLRAGRPQPQLAAYFGHKLQHGGHRTEEHRSEAPTASLVTSHSRTAETTPAPCLVASNKVRAVGVA